MEVVIPMAGRGQRFVDAGYATPKPMIEVLGRPMYSLAVDALPLEPDDHLTFVVLDEHARAGLADDIHQRYGDRHRVDVIPLARTTGGQAETVLLACGALDERGELMIHNADTVCAFERPDLDGAAGGLVLFEADGDHWSFGRVDDNGCVVQVAEKTRISSLASSGTYLFDSVDRFAGLADAALVEGRAVNGEYYVAPLYQDLLDAGGRVAAFTATSVEVLGTPAELDDYLCGRTS